MSDCVFPFLAMLEFEVGIFFFKVKFYYETQADLELVIFLP